MLSKIMVLGVILLLFVLVLYLLHDSPMVIKMKEMQEESAKKKEAEKKAKEMRKAEAAREKAAIKAAKKESSKKILKKKKTKITDSPAIFVRCSGERCYEQHDMYSKKIFIGSDSRCDIVLDDETVEKYHAYIEKIVKEEDVHFEFVNLSKNNPVKYLNQENCKYQYLGYKKGVVLEGNEVFKIGDTKLIVKCPIMNIEPNETDRIVMNENKERELAYQKNEMVEEQDDFEEVIEVSSEDDDFTEIESEETVTEDAAEEHEEPTLRIEKAAKTIVYRVDKN